MDISLRTMMELRCSTTMSCPVMKVEGKRKEKKGFVRRIRDIRAGLCLESIQPLTFSSIHRNGCSVWLILYIYQG